MRVAPLELPTPRTRHSSDARQILQIFARPRLVQWKPPPSTPVPRAIHELLALSVTRFYPTLRWLPSAPPIPREQPRRRPTYSLSPNLNGGPARYTVGSK